jgi:hypothetical protein
MLAENDLTHFAPLLVKAGVMTVWAFMKQWPSSRRALTFGTGWGCLSNAEPLPPSASRASFGMWGARFRGARGCPRATLHALHATQGGMPTDGLPSSWGSHWDCSRRPSWRARTNKQKGKIQRLSHRTKRRETTGGERGGQELRGEQHAGAPPGRSTIRGEGERHRATLPRWCSNP